MNNTVKFAIQKDGRLTSEGLNYLSSLGFDLGGYDINSRKFHYLIPNTNVEVIFLRYWDIFEFLEKGYIDYAYVGGSTFPEVDLKGYSIYDTHLGQLNISLCGAKSISEFTIKDLENKTIATRFINITQWFLDNNNINAKLLRICGSVEVMLYLGLAEYFTDVVVTGETLYKNGFVKYLDLETYNSIIITKNNKEIYVNDKIFKFDS